MTETPVAWDEAVFHQVSAAATRRRWLVGALGVALVGVVAASVTWFLADEAEPDRAPAVIELAAPAATAAPAVEEEDLEPLTPVKEAKPPKPVATTSRDVLNDWR